MITNHARLRLFERYPMITNSQYCNIDKLFFTKPHYQIIDKREGDKEIRQITFKGTKLQAITKDGWIVTVIEPTFLKPDELPNPRVTSKDIKTKIAELAENRAKEKVDYLRVKILELEKRLEVVEKKLK